MASWLLVAALAAVLGSSGGSAPKSLADAEGARWRTPLCVGVSGLNPTNAQYVVDRISQRAAQFGIRAGAPGCAANLLIVFSADPSGQARAIARERSDPASVTGVSGQTAGLSAFNAFVTSTAPVRWWRVVQPLSDRGEVVSRNNRLGEAPRVNVDERGRLRATVRDGFSHVIVIVDLAQVNGVRLEALSDYLALVGLAPVEEPDAAGASILGLFSGAEVQRMSPSDEDFLREVYR
ncbi:MAG TPA: hypothetical protein PKY87_14950 [Terricaulis sp.]|nr:hypothetical protein [Terricaulis sp.]